MRQMMTDSTMNCTRMLPFVAPSALRVPISRVRSVMDTSMIFITPMPPTSRLMPAMTAMARLMVESISVMLSIRLSMLEAVAV